MRRRLREAILLVLSLVLIPGIGGSTLAETLSSQAILQKLEEVQNNTLENTLRIEELSSQVSVLREQNREILALLKEAHREPSYGRVATQCEQMEAQIEELQIRLQILVKAIMVLIGVLILILLYMIFRSRRSSPYGRLRI